MRKKKHNRVKTAQTRLKKLADTTCFYHSSFMEDEGAVCLNTTFNLTKQEYLRLNLDKFTWSGCTLLFCDSEDDGRYVKITYLREKKPQSREELSKVLFAHSQELIEGANAAHIRGLAYFITPDYRKDIESQKDTIIELFEEYNAYEQTTEEQIRDLMEKI